MSNKVTHSLHMVEESPWPILSSIFALGLTSGIVNWFFFNSSLLFLFNFLILFLISLSWWRDVSCEASFLGLHTNKVEQGIRIGMILFIISEVFFFLSFFWAYFNSSGNTSVELGSHWPPLGVTPFDPFSVPFLNTVILLSSGVSVTSSHYSLMEGNHSAASDTLFVTIMLGFYFTLLQVFEYVEASFNISDSAYGSAFFLATGFHGIHVIVGSLFLLVSWYRMFFGSFNSNHHFGLEAASWYWHFVDVVWLFLFISVYWWGGLF